MSAKPLNSSASMTLLRLATPLIAARRISLPGTIQGLGNRWWYHRSVEFWHLRLTRLARLARLTRKLSGGRRRRLRSGICRRGLLLMFFSRLLHNPLLFDRIFCENANKVTGNRRSQLECLGKVEQFFEFCLSIVCRACSLRLLDPHFLRSSKALERVQELFLYVFSGILRHRALRIWRRRSF